MCQGGKPDTGEFHSSYIGMNVCGMCAWSMACVLRQRIEYYYYYDTKRTLKSLITITRQHKYLQKSLKKQCQTIYTLKPF